MTPKPTSVPQLALLAIVVILQSMAPVAGLRAAQFDEKLTAPAAPNNDELRSVIRDYFATYARVNTESLSGVVRDRAAYASYFDSKWRLQRAIDTGRDLGDLSEFGVTPKGDGSYSVDIARFPQWTPLSTSVVRLLSPELFESYAPELLARGFRNDDIEIMRAYVTRNVPEQAVAAERLALAESFANRVRPRVTKARKLESSEFLSLVYQSNRILAEANRAWTVSLLDLLDGQRQRILESYFAEQDRQGSMTIAPDDIPAAGQRTAAAIASGEYFRKLDEEKARIKDMEVRQ
jgi:hypothetical protein